MNQATLIETYAELAGLVAKTNAVLNVVAKNSGNVTMAAKATLNREQALAIQHHLEREAGLYEATVNEDPFGPEAA